MRTKAFLLAALVAATQIAAPVQAIAQSDTRTGCMNQWLFNGLWRAKVTKAEPIMDGSQQTGWRITQTWRNGTSRELSPADSQFKEETLNLSALSLTAEGHNQQALVFNNFAPAGEFTYTQSFFGPNMKVDPSDKPRSLDVTFDGQVLARMNKPHFSTRQYNFDYNLDCVAAGAAAQAQGGSSQLAAQQGCMNQWMSNGIWKMRVLAVTPFPVGTVAKNQFGWHIRQEWINITHMKVFPGGLADIGNRVAPTNTSDEFLATKSGNDSSSANVVGGFSLGSRNLPFAPGVPYTFDQLISWGTFNAADAPTRLLVTFDAATQEKIKLAIPVPQYRSPANFRISLDLRGNRYDGTGTGCAANAPTGAARTRAGPVRRGAACSTATSIV